MENKRRPSLKFAVGLALLVAAQWSLALADEAALSSATNQPPSVEELVKLKQNPVSGLRQIVLQDNVDPNYPKSGDAQSIY